MADSALNAGHRDVVVAIFEAADQQGFH